MSKSSPFPDGLCGPRLGTAAEVRQHIARLRAVAVDFMKDKWHEFFEHLFKRVRKGDMEAAKLLYELTFEG